MSQIRILLALILTVVYVGTASAQTPHQHQNSETLIDGAKHPEQIPDAIAYRMVLLDMANNPAHVNLLELSTKEGLTFNIILADFKTNFDALVSRYNTYAANLNAQGLQPDTKTFHQQMDDLALNARTAIRTQLIPLTALKIDVTIQKEKSHMRLHLPEVSQ